MIPMFPMTTMADPLLPDSHDSNDSNDSNDPPTLTISMISMIPMISMIDMVPTILPQLNEFGVAMRNVQLPEYYNISTLNLVWQKRKDLIDKFLFRKATRVQCTNAKVVRVVDHVKVIEGDDHAHQQ